MTGVQTCALPICCIFFGSTTLATSSYTFIARTQHSDLAATENWWASSRQYTVNLPAGSIKDSYSNQNAVQTLSWKTSYKAPTVDWNIFAANYKPSGADFVTPSTTLVLTFNEPVKIAQARYRRRIAVRQRLRLAKDRQQRTSCREEIIARRGILLIVAH